MKLTNNHNISLATAVWLATSEYDYVNEPNYISVTTLMKPVRQLALRGRDEIEQVSIDVTDFLAARMGHAFHDSIERAWVNNASGALAMLGYPEKVCQNIVVNPSEEYVKYNPDCIPVYMEKRTIRSFMGKKIGGKFDFVADGMVQDFKSTSTYAWTKGSKDEDYILQGSLYRWLNPDIITEDIMRINFIFKDWNKNQAKSDKDYPQHPVCHKDLKLMSLEETEQWVKNKIRLIDQYKNAPDEQIPECSDKDLWRSDPVYKYYSDPSKVGGKSTKNFDNLHEANMFKVEKGKGVVLTVPGEARRCEYCDVRHGCKQRERIRPDLQE